MNSLKTMLMVAVLAVVAYGMYVSINSEPGKTPPEMADDWSAGPPEISMPGEPGGMTGPGPGTPTGMPPVGAPPMADRSHELSPARPFSERAPAPPFNPAPMPPEIAAKVQDIPSGGLQEATPYPAYGSNSASQDPVANGASSPPLPNQDGSMAPPLPPEIASSPRTGMSDAPKSANNEIRPEFAEFLSQARSDLEQGRFRETLGILSSRYGESDQTEAEAAALTELLDQVAGSVIYSTEHHLEPAYEVQVGDTLPKIAEKYGVPTELLAKINAIADPMKLQTGEELKVVRGPFRAVVELDEHRMVLWLQDLYAGRFPIGVGTDEPNLEGSFVVLEKNREPVYYSPAGRVFDPGDPLNPLGQRRIGLGGPVAIHGTNDEGTIGETGGPGTIRLGDRDAEDVFDILSLGSRIVVQR